ncbi:S9 family peptidase [Arthrobacter sp. MYb224]|uniref:prolyl oligopeptidase family serine peptidase n=1 Tax=Arthrobacter sp. MYb224 TaxID=1848600 RepID=UPI000CFCE485|nr:prolyl oligopeptidase family serine peptidase [Arthrobacter sp. MYb224]PQZ98615.1 S9 family peptidase [Arthrobacter sp. MYb224]
MPSTPSESLETTNPYAWLEATHDDAALEWVRAQTQRTEAELHDADFSQRVDAIRRVLDAQDRIPMVTKRGDYYYNFWRDAEHRLGLWRRTTWDSYRTENPQWEILLDMDGYALQQGEPWHFAGSAFLRPAEGQPHRRALIRLSPDGGDQVRVREFDLETLRFIDDGFDLAVAKTSASWIDENTLLVASATNESDTTRSTYARTARKLTRGTALEDAEVVFEVAQEHVAAFCYFDSAPGFERIVTTDAIDFYNSRTGVILDGTHHNIEVPTDVQVSLHRQWVLFAPQTDWEHHAELIPAGSLAIGNLTDFLNDGRIQKVIFQPDAKTSLQGMDFTANYLLVSLLHDVAAQIRVFDLRENFAETSLPLADPMLSVSVGAVDDEDAATADDYWMTVTGFTTPTTLFRGSIGAEPEVVKRSPERFDAAGFSVTQHFARSNDGTRVPYFQVADARLKLDGENSVLMDGYGGFQHSMTPGYAPAMGAGWLSRRSGNGRLPVYVMTNIRGGGEYGPSWHRAALRENRHRAYEDFAAIAEDLVTRGVTRRARLAATGRSNGGLLMGNMIAGYPQLFGAISCGVPLLDMQRYTQLAAGHSWIAEYGDPDVPQDWVFLRTFSPLHRLDDQPHPTDDYPASLIWTTTTDDRVGPSQARKMAARMIDKGIANVRYHEPEDGGHAGSTDNESTARMLATSYEFLWRQVR